MSSKLRVSQVPLARVARQTNEEAIAAESAPIEPKEDVLEAAVRPEVAPASQQEVPYKVLIVEDATELAEVIAATLERINIFAFHETHVERALSVYEAEHPDVILLDIGLPDKTGWKLMDAIKDRDEEDRPLVIVITAHGDPANRLMGKLQGVHSYLLKPFTPNEVEQVVGQALASRYRKENATEQRPVVEQGPLPEFIQRMLEGEWTGRTGVAADNTEDTSAQPGEGVDLPR